MGLTGIFKPKTPDVKSQMIIRSDVVMNSIEAD